MDTHRLCNVLRIDIPREGGLTVSIDECLARLTDHHVCPDERNLETIGRSNLLEDLPDVPFLCGQSHSQVAEVVLVRHGQRHADDAQVLSERIAQRSVLRRQGTLSIE